MYILIELCCFLYYGHVWNKVLLLLLLLHKYLRGPIDDWYRWLKRQLCASIYMIIMSAL